MKISFSLHHNWLDDIDNAEAYATRCMQIDRKQKQSEYEGRQVVD